MTILAILLILVALGVGVYVYLCLDLIRRLPPEGETTIDGVTTIEDAVRACQESGLRGWELVAYAQQMTANKFEYSRRNPWDTPRRAFKRGMGYCAQQAFALKLIYDGLGVDSWVVQTLYAKFPPKTIQGIPEAGGVGGHSWLRVRVGDEVRDVDPYSRENSPGVINFEILAPVTPYSAGKALLAHIGASIAMASYDRSARRWAAQHSEQIAAGEALTRPGYTYRGETRQLDQAARREAPGAFIELSDGWVHYELDGPPQAQVVALVNGFSVPFYVWDPTFKALTEAGLRVLRYDLYGRGYSDRPDTVYDLKLFLRQLAELLQALEIEAPVALAGLSMGGPITAAFANEHPESVRRLVLIDPSGFQGGTPTLAKVMYTPVMGEIMMNLLGGKLLATTVLDDFYRSEKFPDYKEQYRPQMAFQGFRGALLSTIRFGPLGEKSATYRQTAQSKLPVLLIWGKEDITLPFEQSQRAREILPEAEFLAVDQAGHMPHYERPEVVNPVLVRFLAAG